MYGTTSSQPWPCAALYEAELGPRTTMRVGGRVEWLLEPASPEELTDAWRAARERGLTPRLLGGGANLIPDDGLHPGVVIATDRMRRLFRPLSPSSAEGEPLDEASSAPGLWEGAAPSASIAPGDVAADPRLVAWAGCTMPALVRASRDLGLAGLEGLAGVPGHLGGGLAMNAGGRWGALWDVVETVRVLEPDGTLFDLPRAEATPGYRDGGLGERVALGAVLRLRPDSKPALQQRVKEFLAEKNRVQPVSEHSSGCIFKNPDPELSEGRSAGKLVEDVGARGLVRGDAIVSPRHGNFIVNRGKATAADVIGLMEEVRERVREGTGVALETEVRRWILEGAER